MVRKFKPVLLLFVLLALSACKHDSHDSFVDKLPQTRSAVKGSQFPHAQRLNKKLLAPVQWSNPPRRFQVVRRTHKLNRYPCSNCHKKPLKVRSKAHFQVTHGTISLKHANPGVLKCQSCHDSSKMDKLKLPNGRRVSFDQSYQLCASCHSKQGRDWAGGAHGKRLHNWVGLRAVYNCTSCHNPHRPAFGQRWPKTWFRPPAKR